MVLGPLNECVYILFKTLYKTLIYPGQISGKPIEQLLVKGDYQQAIVKLKPIERNDITWNDSVTCLYAPAKKQVKHALEKHDNWYAKSHRQLEIFKKKIFWVTQFQKI